MSDFVPPKPLVDLHRDAPDFYTPLQKKRHRQLSALAAMLADVRATADDDYWIDREGMYECVSEVDNLLAELTNQLGNDLLFKKPEPMPQHFGGVPGWSND